MKLINFVFVSLKSPLETTREYIDSFGHATDEKQLMELMCAAITADTHPRTR
jgi:hypothetical protein